MPKYSASLFVVLLIVITGNAELTSESPCARNPKNADDNVPQCVDGISITLLGTDFLHPTPVSTVILTPSPKVLQEAAHRVVHNLLQSGTWKYNSTSKEFLHVASGVVTYDLFKRTEEWVLKNSTQLLPSCDVANIKLHSLVCTLHVPVMIVPGQYFVSVLGGMETTDNTAPPLALFIPPHGSGNPSKKLFHSHHRGTSKKPLYHQYGSKLAPLFVIGVIGFLVGFICVIKDYVQLPCAGRHPMSPRGNGEEETTPEAYLSPQYSQNTPVIHQDLVVYAASSIYDEGEGRQPRHEDERVVDMREMKEC